MPGVVVVGGGLAGMTTALALRTGGYDGPVTLVGAERHRPYDRPPLSKQVLRGEREPVFLGPEGVEAQLDLRLGVAATGIAGREVLLDSGERLGWDRLVIATGAVVRTLPGVPQVRGVHYLRTLDDCRALAPELRPGRRVVIAGGGFVGCEVAASARALGAEVTIVEPLAAPLVTVVGTEMAGLLVAAHEEHGVDVRSGVGVAGLEGAERVRGVVLTDGRTLPADVVIVGVGVRPDTGWLDGSGIAVDDGVVVDEHLVASVPDVYAVGDVARWYDLRLGRPVRAEHWTNATETAEVAAANILGGQEVHSPVPYVWSDQYDLKLQSLGWPGEADETRLLTVGRKQRPVVLYGRGGRLWGVAGLNAVMVVRGQHANIAEHAPLDDVEAALRAA